MTLQELGAKFKAKNPRFASLSDEEAGTLYIKKFPQERSKLTKAVGPRSVIDPKKVKAAGKQTEVLETLVGHTTARTTLSSALEAQKLVPLQAENAQQNQKALTAQARNAEVVAAAASEKMIDAPTHAADYLEQQRHTRALELAAEQQRLAVEQAQKLEDNRLRGYKKEVSIDLEAITKYRLAPHDTVLSISAHLQKLIMERENLVSMTISEDTRHRLLATQDQLIEAFKANLNVQIQRHLLEAGNKEDVGGDEADSEDEGNDREDTPGGEE